MLGYEIKDADTYALWGVDYLKLDSCNTDDTPVEIEIAKVRDALNATGRPIFFSLCGTCITKRFVPSIGSSIFFYCRRCWWIRSVSINSRKQLANDC